MQISISKTQLESLLTNLQPFLEKKDFAQIISHILFEAKDGNLILKATDYEIGLKAQTNALTIQQEGIATVNGKQILDIVRRLKDGEIILQTDDSNFFIKQSRSSFKLNMFNAQEFPTFPETITCSKIDINSLQVFSSLKKVSPVVDTNNVKFEMRGALLDIKPDYYCIVATDSRRLAVVKTSHQSTQELSIIIPKRAIVESQKLFFENVEFYYDSKYIIIKNPNYFFFSKLINGNFVNYQTIIPESRNINIVLPKEKIVGAIKLINAICNNIKMTLKPNEILFESLEDIEARTQIEATIDIEQEITIGVNSLYMLDFLSQIDTADFHFGLNDANTSFVLKSENFTTIIMPIIL